MKKNLTLLCAISIVIASAFITSCNSETKPEATTEQATAPADSTTAAPATESYACPMHPEEKSDKAGNCSKCGMPLEKKS